jgi:hypothetical protein
MHINTPLYASRVILCMHVILDRLVHITCLARKYGQIELPIYAQKYEHFYQDSKHIDKFRFYLRWWVRLNDSKRFQRTWYNKRNWSINPQSARQCFLCLYLMPSHASYYARFFTVIGWRSLVKNAWMVGTKGDLYRPRLFLLFATQGKIGTF